MKQEDIQSPQLCENIQHRPHNPRRSAIFKQQNAISLTKLDTRLQEKNDMLVAQIQKIVKHMPSDDKQLKAERHIYDAYYLRTIRNDIDLADKVILKCLWIIENSRIWSGYLLTLTILYQILAFFEKPYPESDFYEAPDVRNVELFILIFLGIDFLITLVLLATKKNDGGFQFNTKRMMKMLFFLVCLTDYINSKIDDSQIRFSRLIRPALMIFFSKDLRRNLKGIAKASKDLLLLFLLYVIIISTFAFIGINLIGQLDTVDLETQDYGDFFKLFNMLFMAATLDFYPDIMIPPIFQGTFYALYFVIYIILFLFLFQPIPLAVVYEGFRRHRMQIAIQDIIKQKSAMMASFISLDSNDAGFLTENQFKKFLKTFYRGQLTDDQVKIIFSEIDKDFNDKIQFDEFNQLLYVLQNSKKISLPRAKPLKCWESLRNFLNKYGLKKFIESNTFGFFMFLVTIVNCCLIISAFFIENLEVLAIFDTIDTVFLGIFIFECLIKIIGLGIYDFFVDGWNVFDITLILLQILFDYILFSFVTGNIVQSIKANRILRIAKIQKVFRLFRAFRSIKLVGYLLRGLEIFAHVKNLLYKIIICVPLILRLILPVQIVFFTYACIGIYIYGGITTDDDNPFSNNSCDPNEFRFLWGQCKYADFNSMGGSYLMMLQVFTASSWGQLVFELAFDTKNLVTPMIFVGSFVFLSIFLLALIGGLVWEVFTVVSKTLFEQEMEQFKPEERVALQLNFQDEALLGSSMGTEYDIRNGTQLSNAIQLQKKTAILNDDNPDILEFRPRSVGMRAHQDEKQEIPIELDFQIETQIYNKVLRVGINPNQVIRKLKPQGDLAQIIEDELLEIQKLYCDYFIDYQEFLEMKFIKESHNIYNVTTEYVVHIRNEIKKDEMFKRKHVNISNHDLLIQNAVLRDTSEMYIKQQEEQYFKTEYGQKFELIKELKFQSKFKVESKILFSLMGILKFPKPNIKYFFQILYLIENYFTYQLLPDCSFFKLLHQMDGKWYLISIEDNQIVFTKIGAGPWTYDSLLFDQGQMRICENLKFMKEVKNPEVKMHIREFHTSMNKMAKQFELDITKIDVRSTIVLYQIKNERYVLPDSTTPRMNGQKPSISPRYLTMSARNAQISQRNVDVNSINEEENPEGIFQMGENVDECHRHVSQTMIFVLSKVQAQESRIVYQNQVMLAQFVLDLAGVIKNYSDNFFQQLEELYSLRSKQRGIKQK
ncbi:unnamed protein product (macronuclear) [Paramecium tetraurelia]|uniref:EF-hand domain-containing protein n=1 Tax=Paramecium tetraurelia TaxID=5888 RepID=A0CES0_PARTE|nr:uncharacterized protein GSPATT00037726001 [Paramecium tetraurelia]CAK69287.1 unnamed protein product [Paramecium tetraurelia]|eukprot:XP_001436684.1 hypothetical protein (macronuclear) [Paramecium tetraurelia strain d4-2]